ncbi:hypothetical protein EV356DRAFT_560474 [Viridothelium virens]|uniref:Nuclear matrix protein n=1 Tax=Viridothelium virens TaxID=1048519 RepID=A0A6A6H3N5_VIRVR|nr:hypothetical protein EV356DRAFT_560474 [Viridothelium virens]
MAIKALQEVASKSRIQERFNVLLSRAREIKRSTGVEPELSSSPIIEDVKALGVEFGGGPLQYSLVEAIAQDIIYDCVTSTTSIDDPEFVRIWDLLDIIQICEETGQCNPGQVVLLLEDLFDTQTTSGCRRVFQYLESRRERIVEKEWDKKFMSILRSCNELLRRRLSRAEDAVFCGRVFFFLFQIFPLGDKSSVNLRGEFHTANTTTFSQPNPDAEMQDAELVTGVKETERSKLEDEEPSKEQADQQEVQIKPESAGGAVAPITTEVSVTVDAPEDEIKSQGVVSNDKLYPIFWHMQEYFSEPPKLFTGNNFDQFKLALQLTIAKFKSIPAEMQQNTADIGRGTKRKRDDETDTYRDVYNPKYLTDRELFDLELSDVAFQKHILVQALIIIDFLMSLTEKGKKKLLDLKVQKAMMFDFTLSDEDTEWALATKKIIADYLQEGTDGKFYCRMVDTVLSRDKNWVRWKVESCPPIVRDPMLPKYYHEAKVGAEKACAPKRIRAIPLGSIDLSFLSEDETANGLERLKQPDRWKIPTIESFVKDAETIDLDLEMADSEEEKKTLEETKLGKTWRALRIASGTNLAQIDKIDDGRNLKALLSTEVLVNNTKDGGEGMPETTNGKVETSVADNAEEQQQEQEQEQEEPRPAELQTQADGGGGLDNGIMGMNGN